MLLAADVGNTNVVFALIDGREIKARWRIASAAPIRAPISSAPVRLGVPCMRSTEWPG